MKLKLIIAFAATVASTGASFGAIAAVSNLAPSGADLPLLDSAGAPLPNGGFDVLLGNYGGGGPDPSDPTAGFAVWESALNAGTTAFGSPNGFVQANLQQDTATSGAFIGQPIFALISYNNGGTLEYAVWQSGPLLDDDQVAGESTTAVALQTGAGDLVVWGSIVPAPASGYGGQVPDSFFANAIQLAPIPEPSSTLLLGLGGLGLLIRRKR